MNNCAFRSKCWMLTGSYLSELSFEWLSLMKPLASKYYLTFFWYSAFVLLIYESRGKHTDGQVRKAVLETILFFALICAPSSLQQHLRLHDTGSCGEHADDAPVCTEGWHGDLGSSWDAERVLPPCVWVTAKQKPLLAPALLSSRTVSGGVNHTISGRTRAGSADIFTI